jgi:hypothetical protein
MPNKNMPPSVSVDSIVSNPWQFACQWYDIDGIHRSITRSQLLRSLGDLPPVPEDVYSREFAEWLAEQYRLAMRKGAELAIAEMRAMPCVHDLVKQDNENTTAEF